ncbi:MAG: hypothetical protein WD424_01690 [Paenibacillaceae bacterium]
MEQVKVNELGLQDLTASGNGFVDAPSSPHSGLAKSAFVCGIIAVSLNLFAITAVIGIFVGIIAIVFGAMTFRHSTYGKTGLVLGLLSMFVILAYVLSALAIKVADPFL